MVFQCCTTHTSDTQTIGGRTRRQLSFPSLTPHRIENFLPRKLTASKINARNKFRRGGDSSCALMRKRCRISRGCSTPAGNAATNSSQDETCQPTGIPVHQFRHRVCAPSSRSPVATLLRPRSFVTHGELYCFLEGKVPRKGGGINVRARISE